MRRAFLIFLLIIVGAISIFTITYKECVSTEYENVEVNIVDEYHRGMYVTPIRAGKVTTMVTHPSVYRITVEYKGVTYTIDGRETYNKYQNKVGQTTIGTLEIRTYDDGTIKHNIIGLEE